MAIKFRVTDTGKFNLRRGILTGKNIEIRTPFFFPIVNIITGPPSVFRNGGIWRCIKSMLFNDPDLKEEGFMTQILHFTEFGISRDTLDNWLSLSITERLRKETGHSPFLFADSGGYRLLYNSHLNTESIGIKPTPNDILNLQLRFGADAVATLDYPIPPTLDNYEAKDRIGRSVENAIETVRITDKLGIDDTIIYLSTHGRNRKEAKKTTKVMLARIEEENLTNIPIGIAIGSLVPLSNSPLQVIDIVKGVVEGIKDCEWIDPNSIPLHAFGVSCRMIPYLAALGIDSFDGSTYVQQAQHLKYLKPGSFSSESFLELQNIDCKCSYCEILKAGGLESAKELIKGKSYGKIEFGNKKTIKSYIYALIALHNLLESRSIVQKVHSAIDNEENLRYLFVDASKDIKMRKTLAYFSNYYPEASKLLWSMGFSQLKKMANAGSDNNHLESGLEAENTNDPEDLTISLDLGPHDFNIANLNFKLEEKKILLILPCSQKKPYSKSASHKFIMGKLNKAGISETDFSKLTISGNYGPVPQEFEEEPEVQRYDFYLDSRDEERIALISKRTREFLIKQSDRYEYAVAYCTSKSYREVIERGMKDIPRTIILPSPIRAKRQSEFKKEDNVNQLIDTMKRVLSGD